MEHAARRRRLAKALGAAAGLAAFGIGAARPALVVQTRPVAGFDALRWEGGGDLAIEQTGREHLSIEAEPAVQALLVAEVRQGRLHIGFAPGRRVVSEQPVRIRLEVKALNTIEVGGAGNLRAGTLTTPSLALVLGGSNELRLQALRARRLDARLDGAGLLEIGGGQVDLQRVVIGGACNYHAAALQSREAELVIDGGGEMQVAVAERLAVRIGGSGVVRYRGRPQVVQTITGAGEVRAE